MTFACACNVCAGDLMCDLLVSVPPSPSPSPSRPLSSPESPHPAAALAHASCQHAPAAVVRAMTHIAMAVITKAGQQLQRCSAAVVAGAGSHQGREPPRPPLKAVRDACCIIALECVSVVQPLAVAWHGEDGLGMGLLKAVKPLAACVLELSSAGGSKANTLPLHLRLLAEAIVSL